MKFSLGLAYLILLAGLLLWPINHFYGLGLRQIPASLSETIFVPDYQARQQIIRNTYLYQNVFLARLFQNKWLIPLEKFKKNLFSLLDLNYYFFNSHPRELADNQNLVRLPFVLVFFVLSGLINLSSYRKGLFYGGLFLISIASLSFLKNFDQFDLLLWPFFALFTYHGFYFLKNKNPFLTGLLMVSLFLVTFLEYLRLFISR